MTPLMATAVSAALQLMDVAISAGSVILVAIVLVIAFFLSSFFMLAFD